MGLKKTALAEEIESNSIRVIGREREREEEHRRVSGRG